MHIAAKWLIASTVVLISLGSGISQAEPTPEEAPAITKKIAIVIDDFGNDMRGTEEMMALTIPFTAAVMPFLPTTRRDAEWAHKLGHDVLVHMPMEPVRGKKAGWGLEQLRQICPMKKSAQGYRRRLMTCPLQSG